MQLEASIARPPWVVRLSTWLIAASSSPLLRRVSVLAVHALLLFRRVAPGRLLQRGMLAFIRMEAACCRVGSPLYKLLDRHISRFERAGTFDRMRRFLREHDRGRAARRLDAWLRIGLLGGLRHEMLKGHLGSVGTPPRLLTQAQISLSPGCDLTCEGCYTQEDRGGAAPRRDDIAFLVDQAAACGAFAVHVIGKGEPFLSPSWAAELLDVIEARPHIFFTIATHGMRIDAALAERIGRIGNLCILVAVDGPEALHDARRGQGSYRKVHEAFARLREHGALFGFSCMVSAKSHAALTSSAFLRAQTEAGCSVGIYSRYFPLAADSVADLSLDADQLSTYREAFEAAEAEASIPLFDLDDVEQNTGCHSRAGESVYIDGITGHVSPCLRVPFAPPECRVSREAGQTLAEALSHPFFEAYRKGGGGCPAWCGANLDAELHEVGQLLDEHAARPERLKAYEGRSGPPALSPRRLPILTESRHP